MSKIKDKCDICGCEMFPCDTDQLYCSNCVLKELEKGE